MNRQNGQNNRGNPRSGQPYYSGDYRRNGNYGKNSADVHGQRRQAPPRTAPRRGGKRPGIRGYSNPDHKNPAGKILLALFGLIAAAIIIIFLLSPRNQHIGRLPDVTDALQANAAMTEEITDTAAEPEKIITSPYAVRNDNTVTLTNEIECQYGILIDIENNAVIADKGGDEKIFPASMTKVMTVLVACENCEDLGDTFTMTNEIVAPLAELNATVAGFAPGEKITVLDMLYGAALPSGADATGGLAEYTAGSEAEFAKLMNAKCEELGLENTHFVNASGLHNEDHYSTCHDIAVILKAAMANETARKVLSAYEYTTSKTDVHPEGITLTGTMFSRIEGSEEFDGKIEIIGGKTGYTGEAGQCLVSLSKVIETGKEYIFTAAKGETKWKPIYDTIYVLRHYLGVSYDGEYVPKYLR